MTRVLIEKRKTGGGKSERNQRMLSCWISEGGEKGTSLGMQSASRNQKSVWDQVLFSLQKNTALQAP